MSSRQGTSREGSSNTKAGAGNRNTQKTVDTSKEISNTKFYLTCIGLFALSLGSVLLHIHLNY